MGEFFRFVIRFFDGWKRRFGLVTLMLVLVLIWGWVRTSGGEKVTISIPIFPDTPSHYWIEFSNDGITWGRFTIMKGKQFWLSSYWAFTIPLTSISAYLLLTKHRITKLSKRSRLKSFDLRAI